MASAGGEQTVNPNRPNVEYQVYVVAYHIISPGLCGPGAVVTRIAEYGLVEATAGGDMRCDGTTATVVGSYYCLRSLYGIAACLISTGSKAILMG